MGTMFTNHRPWLRFIVEPSDEGGAAAPTPTADPAPSSEDHSGEDSGTDPPTGGEDSGGQGADAGGDDVAKQLAKITAERDEALAKVAAHERAQMTEAEKAAADIADQTKRAETAEAKLAELTRAGLAAQACRDAGLPEGMAPRLSGTTAEELAADAKALAGTIGYDRAPVDPSQGKGTGGTHAHNTLADALSAYYGTGNRR